MYFLEMFRFKLLFCMMKKSRIRIVVPEMLQCELERGKDPENKETDRG